MGDMGRYRSVVLVNAIRNIETSGLQIVEFQPQTIPPFDRRSALAVPSSGSEIRNRACNAGSGA